MPTNDRHLATGDIGPHRHMTEAEDHRLTGPDDRPGVAGKPAEQEPFDREISLRGILWTAGSLVAVTLLSCAVVFFLLRGFREADKQKDPPPSPIPAANEQAPPPEPRLQTRPEQELRDVRSAEDRLLTGAAVDAAHGTAHIPIDVAMEVIATRGLGPEVVGGSPVAAAVPPPAATEGAPAALMQSARPPLVPAAPASPASPVPAPPQ